MSIDDAPKGEERGVPAWVMTFADLMTLLMCFFVLLLSFSEMDIAKFKMLAGSMRNAFGVQAEIEARTIPKGTSVIAREFSPGKPEPTPFNTIMQHTIDSNRNSLDALFEEPKEVDEARRHALRISKALEEEINRGDVAVEVEGARIIIRILEKASFASASADLRREFKPILHKIAGLIDSNNGVVTVSGHTDNLPISTSRFRSNWELSTSRAVSVAHELLFAAPLDPLRFLVVGHAETRPLADNDSDENRARNRRVDISITRGLSGDTEDTISVDATPRISTDGSEL